MSQKKQKEWEWQWTNFENTSHDVRLLEEWYYPNSFESFRNKTVLDCGCGRGTHLLILSPYIKKGVGIDLNASSVANQNFEERKANHLRAVRGDLATVRFGEKFDFVCSTGVLHHTDNPTKSFNNIKSYCKKGGRVIVWVYSKEGNGINRLILEPLKSLFFLRLSKPVLDKVSKTITVFTYLLVYSLYLLPLYFLPFYDYFRSWRRLNFYRNNLNVLDKLNAPTTHFIPKKTMYGWFNSREFKDVHISLWAGVGWRGSGTKIS